jgi:phosphoenolpyruvate carboxykinase (GTP)
MVDAGTFIRLNPEKRPNSFLAAPTRATWRASRSAPSSARHKEDAGPTNNWAPPARCAPRCERALRRLHARPHDVRHPVQHGPARLAHRQDRRRDHRQRLRRRQHAHHDPHGLRVLDVLGETALRPLHALGGRAARSPAKDVPWPCEPDIGRSTSSTSPRPRDLVLRLGLRRQRAARQEVPGAAHRLGDGARRGLARRAHAHRGRRVARGREDLRRAAFPSACGKTNLAMLVPPKGFEGWKVTTVGDDIAWIKPGPDGKLRAINPEAGFFGVAPGTNMETNPNAMLTLTRELDLHQRRAHRRRRRVVGGHDRRAARAPHRLAGQRLDARLRPPGGAPNSRFTAPAAQCPSIDPDWENPRACRSAPSSSAAA